VQLQPYAKQQLQGCGARHGVIGGCQGVGEKCGSYRLLLRVHSCLQQQISAAFDCIGCIQLCGCSSWTAAAVKGINSSTTLLCHRSSAQAACSQLCTRPIDGVACQAAPALSATQLTRYEKANCACGCVVLKQQPACDLCHSSSCWHDTTACGSVEASCTSLLVRPCSYCFVLVRVCGVMVCCVLRSSCAVQPRHLPGLSAVGHAVPGVGLLLRLASCQQPTCKSPNQPTSCTSRSLQVLWLGRISRCPLLLFVSRALHSVVTNGSLAAPAGHAASVSSCFAAAAAAPLSFPWATVLFIRTCKRFGLLLRPCVLACCGLASLPNLPQATAWQP
jgi:hypothetical protein